MQNDIIKEIWEIRGLVDEAIETHDIELYNLAMARFNKVFVSEVYQKTFATASLYAEYKSYEDLVLDRESNFGMVAYTLGRLKNEVQEQPKEITRNIQLSSILEIVNYTREMYDVLLRCKDNPSSVNDGIDVLFSAIESNLRGCCEYYAQLVGGDATKQEAKTLNNIYNCFIEEFKYFNKEIENLD